MFVLKRQLDDVIKVIINPQARRAKSEKKSALLTQTYKTEFF